MDNEVKAYIRRLIQNDAGDDLERAKNTFRNRSADQMQQEWGQSGKTCQSILDEYQKARDFNAKALRRFDFLA